MKTMAQMTREERLALTQDEIDALLKQAGLTDWLRPRRDGTRKVGPADVREFEFSPKHEGPTDDPFAWENGLTLMLAYGF